MISLSDMVVFRLTAIKQNGPLRAQYGPLIGERNRYGLDVVDQRAQAWPRSVSSSEVVQIENMV